MKIEIFGNPACAFCRTTKNKLSHFLRKWGCSGAVELVFVDLDTVDGRAEAAFRDVYDVPTTIVSDNGTVLARWDKVVPQADDVKKALEGCVSPR